MGQGQVKTRSGQGTTQLPEVTVAVLRDDCSIEWIEERRIRRGVGWKQGQVERLAFGDQEQDVCLSFPTYRNVRAEFPTLRDKIRWITSVPQINAHWRHTGGAFSSGVGELGGLPVPYRNRSAR